MKTLLDKRSRPTNEAERARLYAQPDPTDGLIFQVCTVPGDCAGCGDRIGTLEPLWIREMPAGSAEAALAQLDDNYTPGEPVYAFHCWGCAKKELAPKVSQYAAERAQADREERLERACVAEANGDLTPDHWYTIMEANMGYLEPQEIPTFVNGACADYQQRYNAREAYLETVRTNLYAFVPQPKLMIEPEAVEVICHPGGLAEFRFTAKVGVR